MTRTQVGPGSVTLPGEVVAQRSYRYVRASLVGLFVALAAAVVFQSVHQGGLLTSISAYYYTPAQAVFVGSLVAIGTAMVALVGATPTEEVALNIGGMLAPVVAIVPTSRGEDYRAALEACERVGDEVLTAFDCPSTTALRDATRDNVANNMAALFVLGGLALVAALLFSLFERQRTELPERDVRAFRIGFVIAVVVYLVALATFVADLDLFIDVAHYAAAIGLFVCMLCVVVATGLRARSADRASGAPPSRSRWRGYFLLALAMVVTAVVLGVLVAADAVTLFWLEAVLIALFVVYWVSQTVERWESIPVPDLRSGVGVRRARP